MQNFFLSFAFCRNLFILIPLSLDIFPMFFSGNDISETEKIDRIYRMLRSERRSRIFSLVVKLLLLGSIVYGYYYLSLPEHADTRKQMIDTIEKKTKELILPVVGSMIQELTSSYGEPVQEGTTIIRKSNLPKSSSPIEITPEMIKAVQDNLPKK